MRIVNKKIKKFDVNIFTAKFLMSRWEKHILRCARSLVDPNIKLDKNFVSTFFLMEIKSIAIAWSLMKIITALTTYYCCETIY